MAKRKKAAKETNIFDNSDYEAKQKALDATLTDITKRFGDGTVFNLGAGHNLQVDTIPTGSLGIDISLGVGGVPRGRILEVYGPESSGKTTLCLHVVAEAQKRGGLAAFIDMEHALDPSYAEKIGVDIERLYVSQPDTGEQALEITEQFVRSGALDIIVIDSVAALVPRAEIEGEMGASHVGLQARLMSQALRKLAGAIKQSNVCVIFTNQLREKVGVMFGCFHYNARVVLADGTTEKIGKLVNQKRDVEVMSYDVNTQTFEPRKVVNWYNNGRTDSFLQFVVDSNEGRGRREFGVTENHLLLTPDGYQQAGELEVGDSLITATKHYLSPAHIQVAIGSLLGDGSLRYASDFNVQLRIGHGEAQTEYAKWKQGLFKGLVSYEGVNSKGGHSFDTIPMYELTKIHELGYTDSKKDPNIELIDQLSPLAAAIWYMDDGTFDKSRNNRCSITCAGLSIEKQQLLAEWFNDRGIEAKLAARGRINFGIEATKQFHAMIAKYVHPSMEYKLLPEYRGLFEELELEPCERNEPVAMPILDIYDKPKTHSMNRFDIEVEGNHCYLVDGVVVHNSPETTPGGRALKFYASVRIDIRRIQQIKLATDIIGNRTRVKIKKNKVAAPFRECEFDIMFNEGISKTGEIVDIGTELNIVEKRGAFYRYNDELLGQGRENAKQFLKENPDMSDEIEDKIRVHFELPMLSEVADAEGDDDD